MKNDIQNIWSAFKAELTKLGAGVSGKTFPISDISPYEDEIGYTGANGIIYLSNSNELMRELDTEHKLMFIKGVFAHELMHQLDSDFDALGKERARLPEFEQEIFATIANVMEDPAIEYWASSYFGGHLLRALKYSIMHLYQEAVPLQESSTAFEQFINAYIQYGDGGLLVGEFTFPQAKEYFVKALPYFDKAIEEPDGTKRIGYAKKVFLITKPLWIEEVKDRENFEKFMKKLRETMKRFGKTTNENGGKPSGDKKKEKPDEKSSKEKRRCIIRKEMGDSSEEETGDSDNTENADDAENSDGVESADKTKKDEESSRKSSDSKSNKNDSDNKASKTNETGLIDKEEYTVTKDDIERIKKEVSALKNTEKENKSIQKNAETIPDYSSEVNKNYKGVSCKNIVTKGDFSCLDGEYQRIVTSMLPGINGLSSQLKRLFVNDREEKEHRASGRINISRLAGSRKTARVFDRRILPANKSNIAVELVVDISGSMCGRKISVAREAAIGLCEVFAKLKIPTKVMAFTADTNRVDVVHYHYLNWNNTRAERVKLLQLEAQCNNFDGYSIRYAGREITRRPEEHKLMIIISDGEPACHYYRGDSGITDTTNAIREASKNATVIGVAIDADAEVLYKMYGKHFIYIKKIDELFAQLGQQIRKEIASW